jgi:hypothetical protein
MTVYYWKTNSFAAPFVSDSDSGHLEGESAMAVLRKIVDGYSHPCGLYAAVVMSLPDEKVVARYLDAVPHAVELATRDKGAYSHLHTYEDEEEVVYIDGRKINIKIEPLWEDLEK